MNLEKHKIVFFLKEVQCCNLKVLKLDIHFRRLFLVVLLSSFSTKTFFFQIGRSDIFKFI